VPITDAPRHARHGVALTLITKFNGIPSTAAVTAPEGLDQRPGRPRTGIDPVTTRHIYVPAPQRRPRRCLTPTRPA